MFTARCCLVVVVLTLTACGASPSGDAKLVVDDIAPSGQGEWSDRSVSKRQDVWGVNYDYRGDLPAWLASPDPLLDEAAFTERMAPNPTPQETSAQLGIYVHEATGCDVVATALSDPRKPEVNVRFGVVCPAG